MNGGVFGSAALWRAFALMLLLAGPASAQQAADTVAPEAKTAIESKPAVQAKRQMVVAANPLAAEAGLEVLRAGGNAADALVAVQTVLGLVEPQSSGMGGGAFLVWYDGKTGESDHFRRPRDGARRSHAGSVPRRRRQAAGILSTLWSAAVRSAFPACPGCSKPSTGVTARGRGSRCSSRRSSSPIRVSPSPLGLQHSSPTRASSWTRTPARAPISSRPTDRLCPPGTCCAIRTMPRR